MPFGTTNHVFARVAGHRDAWHEVRKMSQALLPMEAASSFSEEERGSVRSQPEAGKQG